jgi:CheY-like chemotaxis protein
MNILFIDDDPEDIELYQDAIGYLNNSEYLANAKEKLICHAYSDCHNIIEVISSLAQDPDLIFLDINMPLVGGKECLRALKAHPRYHHIPAVMLSTSCPTEVAEQLKSHGAIDCIQKPAHFKDLVKIFAKFIFQKYV